MIKKTWNIILTVLLLGVVITTGFLWQEKEFMATTGENTLTVVIDPGHGGRDPGKEGVNGVLEKDINLAIALYLKECYERVGINVILTRTEDVGLYEEDDNNKKSSDMKKRCEIVENAKPDIVISIHQNSYIDEEVNGAQVFHYEGSENGRILATYIQNRLGLIEGMNKRPVKANNEYYILRNTSFPTVIVECGFLSNKMEAGLLCDEEYQQSVANAIFMGTLDFLKTND